MSREGSTFARLRGTIAGIGWPPAPNASLAQLTALLLLLERSQWLAPEEIEAGQRRQLALLARHSEHQSPFFAARLKQSGLTPEEVSAPGGLQRLPVLRRRELQARPGELYCRQVPKSHMPLGTSQTSGSTGEPVVLRRTSLNQLFWQAQNLRSQAWQGVDMTRCCSVIRATVSNYEIRPDWGRPISQLFETGPLQRIPIVADVKQQVAWLAEFKPETLIIYPSTLGAILRHCREHGIVLDGLRRILTIGETLSPRIRAEAEAQPGVTVADSYSSQEVGIIATQCPESGLYHVMAESLIVEVLDAEGRACREGDVGRLVLTDLHNFATPLLRYDIGDYAEVGGACACGRGLPTLKRVLGRERNLLVKSDGTRHWPLVGFARFREVAPVIQYQMIQRALDRIEVRLVVEAPLTAAQESGLGAVIRQALDHPFELQFTYFAEEIPRSPGGKFEEFLSDLPA